MGAGCIGLADALAKYDRAGPDRFEAYADFRIRGAMIDELRSYDPLSRDLRDLNNRIATAVRKLTCELGRPPEETEIADVLRLPLVEFRMRLAKLSFGGIVSLDTTGNEGIDGLEVWDDGTDGAESQLLCAERRDRLASAISELPERLQTLLKLYYEQDCTLREIGEQMGFTESRACQLHSEAIQRLRATCEMQEEHTGVRRSNASTSSHDRAPKRTRRSA
jgi:RNA polymerase sigma factor FliA